MSNEELLKDLLEKISTKDQTEVEKLSITTMGS